MKACAHGWLLVLPSTHAEVRVAAGFWVCLLMLSADCLAGRAAEEAAVEEAAEYPRIATAPVRPADGAAGPVRYYQRQPTFYIPFNVSPTTAGPTDAVLFVSGDTGTKWDVYARQPAGEKFFLFRAARDGEYWFASRMVPTGSPLPENVPLTAELRIVVDTSEPKLALDARLEAGELVAAWEARDEFLLSETVSLQYQVGLGQPWQTVALGASATAPDQGSFRGQTRWRPEGNATWTAVKLEARDSAGNVSQATRRLFSLSSPFGTPATPAPSSPTTDIPADPFAQGRPIPAAGQTPIAIPPPPAEPPQPLVAAASSAATGIATTGPNAPAAPGSAASNDGGRAAEAAPVAAPSAAGPPGGTLVSSGVPADPADAAAGADGTSWPRASQSDPLYHSASFGPTASPVGPPAAQQVGPSPWPAEEGTAAQPASTDTAELSAAASRPGLPSGERPRMTRARRFNLDYAIDAVGPAGVEKVELWRTRNAGQDWELWLVDEDRVSPLTVEVDQEGIYGFRVVIVSANGLASQTPRSGDPADLWVGVDTTQPAVEITSAAYGIDAYAGQLDIRWTASDDNLGERPVTLTFSETQTGPWTTIASGLPNTGQYYWRVDSRMPEQFYLRLEVRDLAGNMTAVQLDQPIRSAGLVPRARIRGLIPAE